MSKPWEHSTTSCVMFCRPIHLSEGMLRVVLVHAGAVILPELGEKLGAYAQKKLAERGVEIHVNTKVSTVSMRGVTLSDGTTIESNTVIWTAGTSPNPRVQELPCKKERGRIVVDQFLEVVGWPGVWAVGDCAASGSIWAGKSSPPTAQHALRQAKRLAQNITASIRGKPEEALRLFNPRTARHHRKANWCCKYSRKIQVFGLPCLVALAEDPPGKLPRFEKRL